MEDKHAYLIMAHSDFHTLKMLLGALDDSRNDIYLHIDKKTPNVDFEQISSWVKNAGLYYAKRHSIYWGHSSIVKCELNLLQQATSNGHYSYYHLVSGADFPLKSQDYIHDFFKDKTNEYITYFKAGEKGREFDYKIKYYYFFMRWIGRTDMEGSGLYKRGLRWLNYRNKLFLEWQKKVGVNRSKKYEGIEFVKGDQWFSITDDFARFIVSRKRLILKVVRFSNGADEIFLQTIAYNSSFKDRIAKEIIREIDWDRGSPYRFEYRDLDELKASDKLFVRKVSYEQDAHSPKLIECLWEYIN